ncbi:MAG: hypothetical protein WCP91_03655 [Candidatus Berkelbacteria bacterium]
MSHFLSYLKFLKIPFSPEVFLHYRTAIALLLLVIILSFIIDFLLAHSFLGPKYRILLAPGVIIHELAHGFACLFTGAKVSEMALFEKDGGHVKHTRPKVPIIGPVIISLAPLIAGIVIIYFASKYLSTGDLNIFKHGFTSKAVIATNSAIIKNLVHFSLRNWILLYIVISTAVTMVPSRQDFINAFLPLLLLILAFLIVSKFTHWYLPTATFNMLLLSALNLLILMLILSIVIFAISNFFRTASS